MDPIAKLKIEKDTTFAFMLAAQDRGHRVLVCGVEDLYAQGDVPLADARPVRCRPVEGDHYQWEGPRAPVDLRDVDAVLMRKDPPFNMDYIFATYILSLAEGQTLLLNNPRGLRDCNEKAYILNFPSLIPPTLVSKRIDLLRAFCHEHPKVV